MAQNEPSLIALMAKNSIEKTKDFISKYQPGKPDEHIIGAEPAAERGVDKTLAVPKKDLDDLLQSARGLGKMGVNNVRAMQGVLTKALDDAKMEQHKQMAARAAGKIQAAKDVGISYRGTELAPSDDSEAQAHSQGDGSLSNEEMQAAIESDEDAQQNSMGDATAQMDATDAVKNANLIARADQPEPSKMQQVFSAITDKAQAVITKSSEMATKLGGKMPESLNKTIGNSNITYGAAIVIGVASSLIVLAVYKIFKWLTKDKKHELATEGLALVKDNTFDVLSESAMPLLEEAGPSFGGKIIQKAANPALEMASFVAMKSKEETNPFKRHMWKFVAVASMGVAAGLGVVLYCKHQGNLL